jgi:hypothetical protein
MSDTIDFGAFDPSSVEDTGANPGTPAETPAAPADPAQGATAQPTLDDLFEVKVGGKSWKVPKDELISGYQRQQDYTRKTMELAEQRKLWDAERARFQGQIEEVKQWLQKPENVKAYLEQLVARTGYEQPTEVTTAAQVKQMLENERQSMAQMQREQIAQATQEIELRRLSDNYAREIDTTLRDALSALPELKPIRGIEKMIREEVAERQPQSLEEAKQMLRQVAEERAQAIKAYLSEQQKAAALQAAPLKKGIEPPSTGSLPAPRSGPTPKLGTPAFVESVMQDMIAFSKQEG